MSYTALYRKYRPNNFKSVVGQDSTVTILKNAIINQHISHAYLFTGPRGTGKTSIAKIFAHAVNCENFNDDICGSCPTCLSLATNDSDIIEIDAASNNGVDEIRTLRDNVKLLPSFCKYKIYIIDEVHMLSTGAFNALLKTLEEPPSHAIFILATTEPNKIPATILSRCQRFDFNKIDMESLNHRLNYILEQEGRTLNSDVVNYISKVSDGGLRDAINLLDQTLSISNDNITISDVEDLSGRISNDLVFDIIKYIAEADYTNLLKIVSDLTVRGKSYVELVNNMLIIFRDYIISTQVFDYFDDDYYLKLKNFNFNSSEVVELSKVLNELLVEMKNSNDQKLMFEIYLMHLVQVINNKNNKHLNRTQNNIENEVNHNELDTNSQFIDIPVENVSENIHTNSEVEENSKNDESLDSNSVILDNSESELLKSEDIKNTSVSLVELKKIRINNVFAGANKDLLNKVLSDYDKINDYISNKTYNVIAALLIDGKVVVASDKYLLFSFSDESYISLFDTNYKHIEIFMNEIYDIPFKVVAVTSLEWEKYRQEFILNKKNNIPYVLIPENDVKLEVSESSSELEDSAMNIFGEGTISVR